MRPRAYTLYEVQQDGPNQIQKEVGSALPFSQGYGFTLFIGEDIKLIMYPARDYSRTKRKFDVLMAEEDQQNRTRYPVGHGWRADYGHVYTLTLRDEGGAVMAKLKMLPKQNKTATPRETAA